MKVESTSKRNKKYSPTDLISVKTTHFMNQTQISHNIITMANEDDEEVTTPNLLLSERTKKRNYPISLPSIINNRILNDLNSSFQQGR